MADGALGETGENAALLLEMDHKSAQALAPIPLRLIVEHNVLGPAKRQIHAIMPHVLVSKKDIKSRPRNV